MYFIINFEIKGYNIIIINIYYKNFIQYEIIYEISELKLFKE